MLEVFTALLGIAIPAAFYCGKVYEKHKQDKQIEELKERLAQCQAILEEKRDNRWKSGTLRPKNLRAC
jgi:hypothetical protein